jgi:ATP-dependent Clp endopeptidase proteolytic subunit ClpP
MLKTRRLTSPKITSSLLFYEFIHPCCASPLFWGCLLSDPTPDLPSLLLKERIVYLGLPLFSQDELKQQVGLDVTELIIAQLLYLQFDDPDKPVYFYINSGGNIEGGTFETEAFAICDTLNYIKPPVHTICIGQAVGSAAVILSSGTKGLSGQSAPCQHCAQSAK